MADTKENIISVATRLFAARGFKNVTVREICQAADVNVAMINYHFRDKNGLYRACIDRLFGQPIHREVASLADSVRDAKSWKAAIREWIGTFSRILRSETGDAALVAGFFRQEVIHASAMSDLIRERYVQPVYDSLERLFAMAVRDADECRRWVETVWSALSTYAMVDPVWHPLFRPTKADPETWGNEFADFLCDRIFSELKYKKG